jgi:hypothetical protein
MSYETIDFQKVSIAEAKAAIDGDGKKSAVSWEGKRRKPVRTDVDLLNETCTWLVGLPVNVRPLHIARQFPRIANNIATSWRRPNECDRVFNDLIVDHRGTRKGFPSEVAKEITELKNYYNVEVFKRKEDSWVLTI